MGLLIEVFMKNGKLFTRFFGNSIKIIMFYFVFMFLLHSISLNAQTGKSPSIIKNNNILEITSPTTGEKIEVANNDFSITFNEPNKKQMTEIVNELGNGWRLPTVEELKTIYTELHLKGLGNFKTVFNEYYKAAYVTLECKDDYCYIVDFEDGKADVTKDYRVRINKENSGINNNKSAVFLLRVVRPKNYIR
jgi:hypothetical protein